MNTRDPKSVFVLPIPTPDGQFLASYSLRGLCGLEFPSSPRARDHARNDCEIPGQILRWHEATTKALALELSGQAANELPPFDLSAGTEFQQRVWGVLQKIASGRTMSYGQVAEAAGSPKAVRAVGGACGANPIPVLVPCHRVLAAQGRIGGFSAGLDWKRKLLAREGLRPQTT